MAFAELAYRWFGRFTKGKRYPQLQDAIRKARMPVSSDIYVATAIFSAVIAAALGGLLGLLVGVLLSPDIFFLPLLMVVLGGVLGGVTYMVMLSYPSFIASERGRNIDLALPYTIGFMLAMSRSGATIVDIFRELATRRDVGELRREAQTFMRDIEFLGRDPLSAARNLAATTPSEKFKSFLEVLISIVETGGEITPYLITKTAELHAGMRESNKKTISSMEFVSELFVILVQFLPLLFMSIIIFMGFVPGGKVDVLLLSVLAYAWTPLGAFAFAVVLATTPPVELKGLPRALSLFSPYRTVPVVRGDARDEAIVKKLRGLLMKERLKRFLSNPFAVFLRNPEYVLILSAPAGIIYLVFTPIKTSTFVISLLIILLPYTLAYELRSKRVMEMERSLPDFLKSLGSASKSGLTLAKSLTIASTAEMGALTDEVRRTAKEIEWGSSAQEALMKMEQRTGISPMVAKAVTLIRKASEAEEDISEVVDIAVNDAKTKQDIVTERKSAMFVYKIIIVMSFFVFLLTLYFIIGAYISIPTTWSTSGEMKIMGVEPTIIKILFYHMLLLQGLFCGLVMGEMGGDIRSGLKWVVLMVICTAAMFEFIIMPMTPTVTVPE
ncbi:MAG: type II secretion system F family protein [Candidatus Hadarchaeales archaeon]